MEKLNFASDYMEGAHPKIMERLIETNFLATAGYGLDEFSASAKAKILAACGAHGGEVYFLTGGTQTNAVAITALLRPYQGAIAAKSGHISLHEAGAIEAGGHKVFELPHQQGKINAAEVEKFVADFMSDENREHMVMPGMVYISQPTEYGTLYSLAELTALHDVCQKYNLYLYIDGARLAYALASPANDVNLKDMAKLADMFYIGGTKCGALIGEALVIPKKNLIPHFFTIIKQRGALLAKGRLLGITFDELFTDDLYMKIGHDAVRLAAKMQEIFERRGLKLYFPSPTNQVFVILPNGLMEKLAAEISFSFWEKYDENNTVVRLATSWATTEENVTKLDTVLEKVLD